MLKKIVQKIEEFDTIVLHRHQRPDPDAIGSQLGLKKLLQLNFPEKTILATGFEEPTLAWLGQMDTVADSDYPASLVIVTDTANTERIDDARYANGAFLIKIDHHPNDDAYGDLLWVDTSSSSTSEMIAFFARELGLDVDAEIARLLYAGIVGDTGRFLYPSTSARTFEMAAYLRRFDFDFSGLSRQMDAMDYKVAKLMGYVYDNLEVDENGAARVVLTQETLKTYDVTDAETAAIVSAPGRIGAVQSWGIFVEQVDGSYRVRLRSKSAIINEIAKRHGGGGHPLASGANSYSLEENEAIYKEIQQVVKDASK
ncbi:TPA: bifunctional oligoribonuclease/PAP phosphatase NrnA [Streptococcus suis]|uniref:Bifunctional oligoribonuclease/PAP phosphatase NrnA n=1 Tax=Streptococcus suivaginalis TaxID=3028082 RepID=A0AA96VT57_9STRE|nr:bifunctional oligoribonuclease/PAP phosphatase NrnA [Streptococcus sp. 29896]MCK4027086.1 bifunctional oligoribonuclease/PAP phosphatase NrnA [Streptococcus suis]WNY47715.1 bifunctional oligoribonuclease/PAP phosphatase NrnA [Streptococcus sp. 29896]HEL1586247.1 bifunctional oligoribonuclease/PAP phosphatase NrnA [Streptococcus suis]